MSWDLIVAGAGTAGTMAALAAARSGLSVCLIDSKPAQLIGAKLCGDALSSRYTYELKIDSQIQPAVLNRIQGIAIYTSNPRCQYHLRSAQPGYAIDRHEFGQRLLALALDSGAQLMDSTRILAPVLKSGKLIGVQTNHSQIRAELIIDCLGVNSVLRNALLGTLDRSDLMICYRQLLELNSELDLDQFIIYLDPGLAPGGYAWINPKSSQLNLGIGVRFGIGQLRSRFQKFIQIGSRILGMDLSSSKLMDAGYGLVPVRRPLESLVHPGYMLAGDSGCTTNPLSGAGIGQSMLAGALAGSIAAQAHQDGFELDQIWRYNLEMLAKFGIKHAKLDLIRRYLQSLDESKLYSWLSCLDSWTIAQLAANAQLKLKLWKLIPRLGLVKDLIRIWAGLRKLERIYLDYPRSSCELDRWRARLAEIA